MGSNPTQRMDVCEHLFYVCVFCVLVAVLRRAGPPTKKSYP
jgi:hypothetical protein